MSWAALGSLKVVPSYSVVIALPTADRSRAYAFARALDLETPGELAEDGAPEPLRVQFNDQAALMNVPTGGFGWITGGRPTASSTTSECLVSLQLGTTTEVDSIVDRVEAAGGRVTVFPVITGSTGRERLYHGYPDVALDMISSTTFDGRIQQLEYTPRVLDGPPDVEEPPADNGRS